MPPVLTHRNQQLYVDLAPLIEAGLEETFLTEDSAAADTTLTVKDIDGYAISHFLVLGELGEESCELVKVHASTAPTGTTITLVAGGTEFAHSAGTRVRRVQFDQIEFSHAATLAGAKSVLATVNVQVDQKLQVYTDTSETSGYYFARFKDSTAATYGSYSDGVPFGGFAENTVGYMIERSLRGNDIRLSEQLSLEDCYSYINECLGLVQGKQVHWPQHQQLNYFLGATTRGVNIVTLPTDIYDTTTSQSIKAVRIGKETLSWIDPQSFAHKMAGVAVTQVQAEALVGATTLEIDNSYDYEDSGSVNIYISGTQYSIEYTGVTRSGTAGLLTGIPASGTGSITVTIPAGTYVWQNETEAVPLYFTVRNGALEYWPLAEAQSENQNIEMDYWTVATRVNSDGDIIDVTRYQMVMDYLTWRIRMKVQNNNKLDITDGWYLAFKERLNDAIRTSQPLFVHQTTPKLNHMRRR